MKCADKKKYKHLEKVKEVFEKLKEKFKENAPKRYYKCNSCGYYHFTSMNQEDAQRVINDINLRVKKREERFIERESEYWNGIFSRRS